MREQVDKKIPLTNTGYVREYCREWCFTNGEKDNPALIKQLKEAFGGGFTHASAKYSGKVLANVVSKDETSVYDMVESGFDLDEIME